MELPIGHAFDLIDWVRRSFVFHIELQCCNLGATQQVKSQTSLTNNKMPNSEYNCINKGGEVACCVC